VRRRSPPPPDGKRKTGEGGRTGTGDELVDINCIAKPRRLWRKNKLAGVVGVVIIMMM